MKIAFSILGTALLALAVSMTPSSASASCTYKKNLRQSGYEFDISSRSGAGCGVQVISISVRRSGRNFANLRSDVDYLAEKAWTADLDGDGRPELVVASRSTGKNDRSVLDVYHLSGNVIIRTTLPTGADYSANRDRFHQDGRRIVRTIPTDNGNDSANSLDKSSRVEVYEFREGKLSLLEQPDPQKVTGSTLPRPVTGNTAAAPKSTGPALTAISAADTAIEITADVTIGKFRTMKLDKPERLAIDFPAASSPLAGKIIKVGNFGIKRARIGLNKGFVRIVLDSDRPVFPKYSITTSDNVMRVDFGTK